MNKQLTALLVICSAVFVSANLAGRDCGTCHKTEHCAKPCKTKCEKPCKTKCEKPCHKPCEKPCNKPCEKECYTTRMVEVKEYHKPEVSTVKTCNVYCPPESYEVERIRAKCEGECDQVKCQKDIVTTKCVKPIVEKTCETFTSCPNGTMEGGQKEVKTVKKTKKVKTVKTNSAMANDTMMDVE